MKNERISMNDLYEFNVEHLVMMQKAMMDTKQIGFLNDLEKASRLHFACLAITTSRKLLAGLDGDNEEYERIAKELQSLVARIHQQRDNELKAERAEIAKSGFDLKAWYEENGDQGEAVEAA